MYKRIWNAWKFVNMQRRNYNIVISDGILIRMWANLRPLLRLRPFSGPIGAPIFCEDGSLFIPTDQLDRYDLNNLASHPDSVLKRRLENMSLQGSDVDNFLEIEGLLDDLLAMCQDEDWPLGSTHIVLPETENILINSGTIMFRKRTHDKESLRAFLTTHNNSDPGVVDIIMEHAVVGQAVVRYYS